VASVQGTAIQAEGVRIEFTTVGPDEHDYLAREARARKDIDQQLVEAGWLVQDKRDANLGAGLGVAIREFTHSVGHGRSDYALYVGRKLVGVLEAKAQGTTLSEVEAQTKKYVSGVPDAIPAPLTPLPFGYESTGAETRFTNFYDPEPRARRIHAFFRPETLSGWLEQMLREPEQGTLRTRLHTIPPLEKGNLWDVQQRAITKMEESLADDRPRALIQMATGSGKTYTAANLSYRLIRYGKAQRILFLVDRGNLGKQAEGEFKGFDIPETGRKFTQEYNIQRLQNNTIDTTSRVCISTIQRMYSILRGDAAMDPELDEQSADTVAPQRPVEVSYNAKVPPEMFDVIIIDECHRSIYSVWRQVVEYFDAYLIGLTATPTKQTLAFFQKNLVMEYPREQAVLDGVNVDFSVYKIRTEITERGSTIEAGEYAGYRSRVDRKTRWELVDESTTYTNKELDRKVVTPDQIRTVIRTFKDRLFTEMFPGRSIVPKTLIFAKNDSHAEDIVGIVREEFGRGNEFAQKITYRTTDGDPDVLLATFRNSPNPRVVVTVDMIATGTDVKPLECLIFMRDTKSRAYFEQMIGRGSRIIDDTDFQSITGDAKHKDRFVVVDAIGVTEGRFPESVQPLERKAAVPLEKIMATVALGGKVDPDIASSLASRLIRMDSRMSPADRGRISALNGGAPLHDLAAEILNALDPDRHVQVATGDGLAPTEEEIQATADAMLEGALRPLADNPALRNEIIEIRKSLEQTIHETVDTLIDAGYSPEARGRAEALISSFKEYIEANKNEIRALQILYSRPYKERLTFAEVKELATLIQRPPRRWTADNLWRAYELIDESKVHGSGGKILTDIVSLVRYTLHQDDELIPYGDQVEARFTAWLAGQEQLGVMFTPQQLQWLTWMKENIASELGIGADSFEYTPFVEHGGIGRAVQVFGDRLTPLMGELTEALAA
jgi:type I restriction enzyme R subunit